ncbi:MAG: DUF3795 domain-containing protein [Thermoleophilia bacterium]|nr:DUF3795 domain-containing protein [Thermoleophilia bacterium]
MIAHCGINCDECPSYKGTITGDETLLASMNREFGNAQTDAIDFVCLGCKYDDPKLIATDCAACAIRSCARAKGKDFCATCDEFEACDTVKPYRGDGTSPRDKINSFLRAKNIRANS